MGERTEYAGGTPNWVDLATSDIEGAEAFYGRLFGWTTHHIPEDEGGPYAMFQRDGKMVAGLAALPGGMTMPIWSTYFAVDDVDATLTAAEAAGGSVMMPAMEAIGMCRIAFAADPTGAAFGLWQAKPSIGAEVVNEVGALVWNELYTADVEAAARFYESVFGVAFRVDDAQAEPYTLFLVGDGMVAGMMGRPDTMGPEIPDYWTVYFGVEDCDASAAAAVASGGTILAGPMDVQGVGRIAVVRDPQGGVFNIIDADDYDP